MRHAAGLVLAVALLGAAPTLGAAPAAAAPPAAARAQAPTRGALLYDTHCGGCHTTQMHWRDRRVVRDWASLVDQVAQWAARERLGWGEEDILYVAQHLNETIYRMPIPERRARLAPAPGQRAQSAPAPGQRAQSQPAPGRRAQSMRSPDRHPGLSAARPQPGAGTG